MSDPTASDRTPSPSTEELNRHIAAECQPPHPSHAAQPARHGVVAVIVDAGRLLVIRRSQHVVAPGAFCFPGGAIESGETEPEALIREIQEELGVCVRPRRRLWQCVTPWNVQLAWWLAESPSPNCYWNPNANEVESIHWLTPVEIGELPELLVSNHHFLRALAEGDIVL